MFTFSSIQAKKNNFDNVNMWIIFFPNSMEKLVSYLGRFSISFEKIYVLNWDFDMESWISLQKSQNNSSCQNFSNKNNYSLMRLNLTSSCFGILNEQSRCEWHFFTSILRYIREYWINTFFIFRRVGIIFQEGNPNLSFQNMYKNHFFRVYYSLNWKKIYLTGLSLIILY